MYLLSKYGARFLHMPWVLLLSTYSRVIPRLRGPSWGQTVDLPLPGSVPQGTERREALPELHRVSSLGRRDPRSTRFPWDMLKRGLNTDSFLGPFSPPARYPDLLKAC